MKQIDRFTISHGQYEGPRLHNDLNKLVDQANGNFSDHAAQLEAANQTIADLLARVKALEANAK